MALIIDCREKDLLKQINQQVLFTPSFKKIVVKSENLPIGDIIIKDKYDNSLLIIERKTIPDLLCSIKDGRYKEQSYRLNGLLHDNHNIIYLIEGDTNNKKFFQKIDRMTFYSALLSLNYYKGFSVIKTQNLSETAIFICNSLLKLQNGLDTNKTPFYNSQMEINKNNKLEGENIQNGSLQKVRKEGNLEILTVSDEEETIGEKDYVHVVKKVKKENVTSCNIDEIMLSQIPGISSTCAIAIMKKFRSIKNIIESYNDYIKEKENEEMISKEIIIKHLFNDIFYINVKGDRRKISKTAVNNLYDYLLNNK